jgi:hypothetical protein
VVVRARRNQATSIVAALTIVQQSQLFQKDLELSSTVLSYLPELEDGEPQPVIMAQAVPNPPTEKKRVKVYELRNNDWFDRGTGFCTASITTVRLKYRSQEDMRRARHVPRE